MLGWQPLLREKLRSLRYTLQPQIGVKNPLTVQNECAKHYPLAKCQLFWSRTLKVRPAKTKEKLEDLGMLICTYGEIQPSLQLERGKASNQRPEACFLQTLPLWLSTEAEREQGKTKHFLQR